MLKKLLGNAFFHACIPPLVIFVVIANALWLSDTRPALPSAAPAASAASQGTAQAPAAEAEPVRTVIPLTLAIFLTGAGGGVISTYFRLKDVAPTQIEPHEILQIYVTPVIAGLLGWICYAFFLTQMLQGPLFPKFVNLDTIRYENLTSVFLIVPATPLDAAKALLWAFVAGFSEKLIPNILDQLAKRAQPADPNAAPPDAG